MTDPHAEKTAAEPPVATPQVSPRKGVSPVWLVPVVALLIAAWLGIRAWQTSGPTIEIEFESASGMLVGKTEVRYKDVRVGIVREMRLSDDLRRVHVKAEMDRVVSEYLSEDTRFWVVEPRISLSGVSGLSTLFSGVYIAMDPGTAGDFVDHFVALDAPLAVQSDDQGRTFTLRAEEPGSLDLGAPVYYRQINVGEVTGFDLDSSGEFVAVRVFVEAPYDRFVKKQSRFWNVSGFGVELNARGVQARIAPLAALLAGGIAFDTPATLASIEEAEEGEVFYLFPDQEAMSEGVYTLRYFYQLQFDGSVRGLQVGAPVEYLGIKVGEVVEVGFDVVAGQEPQIRALIALEPQRLGPGGELSGAEVDARLRRLVEQQGLRAQLRTGNLLTGALFVDLVMLPEVPGAISNNGPYPTLPTAPSQVEQVTRQLTALLEKVNQFPLEKLGRDLGKSLASLNRLLAELERSQVATKASTTLDSLQTTSAQLQQALSAGQSALGQLEQTLNAAERTITPESSLIFQVREMAREVSRAAASFRQLGDELNRNPRALIFGREGS